MDDLDRFFPIRPRNVPRDDLDSYLRMYADEAGAFRASQRSSGEVHAEWTVNTRMPVMRTLQGLGVVGQPMGDDTTRLTNLQAGLELVSATWAQRAANAWLAFNGLPLIQVDGSVGPETLTALRTAMLSWYASLTSTPVQAYSGQTMVGTYPMPIRSGSGAGIARPLYAYMTQLTQVADPPRASGPTLPDATSLATAAGTGIAQGLTVLALLGLGAYALSRR